jgi:Heparinase II/III-like protein/Heparinase II/III N-terminus
LRSGVQNMGFERWRQLGQRLARMDGAELRERLRQEVRKRQDAALAQIGYDFSRRSYRSAGDRTGRFFFAADSVESILSLLCQRFPDYSARTLEQAERICRHRFDLLGYRSLDYGDPIDWHLDAVHGKHAPRKPFYRIPYLDYAELGDSKVTWELNRHQHFVTLAKAHRLTGERRYAEEIYSQWRHWQVENPYPIGINWASSLEVAFRALSWIWTYKLLDGASGLPDFRGEWLRGLALHGWHIERYLSTYFSPNTHLIGEGVALFFLGVLFPELASAERWRALGWEIILRQAQRQVREDGFHFEQSTYYHVYTLDFFMHAAVLASMNGIPLPKEFEEKLERMLSALCMLARHGPPPRFGDDDGGRLFDPHRNHSEHLLDPLATGAILFRRGDYKAAAVGLRKETIWLLGSDGVRQWDELQELCTPSESNALENAGFYLLQAPETQLVMDAGPLGGDGGGHGHADALSVTLQSHGHTLLIDPGTYEYIGPGGDRDLFRGTSMHNTVCVDGANQSDPAGPFSWKQLTKSCAEQWIQGEHFDMLVASCDGYRQLTRPVTHRRWVISLKNGMFLVRDVIEGHGTHHLDIAWHLGATLQLAEEGIFRTKDAAVWLGLFPAHGHGWARESRRASWSPAYGQKDRATVLNFSAEVALPTEFAVLLVTLEGARFGVKSFTRVEDTGDVEISSYHYADDDGEYYFFFGRGNPWRKDSWSSDAEFVCWGRKPGMANEHLIFCGGSYAQKSGGAELRCLRPVKWAESVLKENGRTVFSSDMTAVQEEFVDIRGPHPVTPSSE